MAQNNDKNRPGQSPEDTEGTQSQAPVNDELDRTKMDIPLDASSLKEITSTEIRSLPEGEIGEDLLFKKGAPFFKKVPFFALFQKMRTLLSRLTQKKTPQKEGPDRDVIVTRYHFIWLPPPGISLWYQIRFYLSRLLILLLGFYLFLKLYQSFTFARQSDFEWQWLLLALFIISFVLSFIGIFLRWSAALFFGFPLIAFVGLLTTHLLLFPTTESHFFNFSGIPSAYLLNQFFIFVLLYELGLLFLVTKPTRLLQIGLMVLIIYGLIGFGMNLQEHSPLEASWLGSGVFTLIPLFFLQPLFVTLQITIVFLFFANLAFLILFSENLRIHRLKGWVSVHLIVLFLACVMSFGLLYKNRVPNLLTFLTGKPLDLALVEVDIGGGVLQLKTKNYRLSKAMDTVHHYRFELEPIKSSKGGSAQNEATLRALNAEGFPVFFLKKEELVLTYQGEPVKKWSLSSLKESQPRLASYLLSAELPPPRLDQDSAQEAPAEESLEPPLANTEGLIIDSPMAGDYFNETLSADARLLTLDQDPLTYVRFFLNDELVSEKIASPFHITLDTSQLPLGSYKLRAVAFFASGREEEKNIPLTKGPHPAISFVRPSLGEYVSLEVPLEISLTGEGTYSIVELFLGDEKIHEWMNPIFQTPLTFNWDTSSLKAGDYSLRVRGKDPEGVQASDWVYVRVGEGELQLLPPEGKGKSPYSKVVFVMDASVSQWDSWNLKPRWNWQKEMLTKGLAIPGLKEAETGVLVFGGKDDVDSYNCQDAEWALPLSRTFRKKIQSALEKTHPKGVSSLFAGITKALASKPQKIIVMTDNADTCSDNIPSSIKGLIGSYPKTYLDIIAFGPLSEPEQKVLSQLASFGAGQFTMAKDKEDFYESVERSLSLHYSLFLGDKEVLLASVNGNPQTLRAGEYLLKVSSFPPLEDTPIIIRNGQTTELKLVIEAGKIKLTE